MIESRMGNVVQEIWQELGLSLVEEIVLDIVKRKQYSEEKIMVFKKQKGGIKWKSY